MITATIKFLLGDWWTAHKDKETETWGIYHPWRGHVWRYGLTEPQAKMLAGGYNRGTIPLPFDEN